MPDNSEHRGTSILLAMAAVAFFLSMAAVGGTFYSAARSAQERRQEICVQIEKLKTAQREAAAKNYAKLDANLRLLRIQKTPAVVEAATEARDDTLKRFAPLPCN